MVPGTVISLDDLGAAMSANRALYPSFFFVEQLFGRALLRGSVLTHVGHGRVGVTCENLVDHFDRVAVLQCLERVRDPFISISGQCSSATSPTSNRRATNRDEIVSCQHR